MRNFIIIMLMLLSLVVSAQKTQSRQILVFDSTAYGSGWKFDWSGEFKVDAVDSSFISGGILMFNHNYLSLMNSSIKIPMTKKRIVASGDTLQRTEIITIPFIQIPTLISAMYSNTVLKNAYKVKIRQLLTKKISEE